MKIVLHVLSRDGCPHRMESGGGWGPQAPLCKHPDRRTRGGDYWCPDGPQQRSDDHFHKVRGEWAPMRPFPPKCPLSEGEEVTRG